jgi:murein DD-endopeptidase MepM/ murein hydrolase activator NlpD
MIFRHGLKCFGLMTALIGLFVHNVSAQSTVHVVVSGDTIYSISRLYQVSQEELMRRNGIADASRIQVGMRLTIPSGTATPVPVVQSATATVEYTVSPNETLYSIARSRGITVQGLRDMNGFSRDYVLRSGQRIRVPGTVVTTPAQTATAPAANTPTRTTTTPAPAATPARNQPPQTETRRASLSIRWPVAAKEVRYMNGKLPGVLVTGVQSESIRSLTRGTVIAAGPYRGYGNIAIVEAEGGYLYLYGACETLSVKQGDRIGAGTELGKLGIYPASGRPDLVFLVYRNDSPIDPARAPRTL